MRLAKKLVTSVLRDFMNSGGHTAPTLVVPSASGMNQNQPWSNQKMLMFPAALPGKRRAPVKCPKTEALE